MRRRSPSCSRELEVSEFATLFRAPVADAAGLAAFVLRAWNLSGLVERYQGFADEFGPYLEEGRMRRLADAEAFLIRTRCVHLFREFPVLDPELPTELAPPVARPRMRAVQVFHGLYEGLAEPSQRHFQAVTSAPGAGLVGAATGRRACGNAR